MYSNVYGVEIPGSDGRAGMAAISIGNSEWDWTAFSQFMLEKLPHYAQPLFVRVLSDIDTTQTFKFKKTELQQQAFHPDRCADQVYFLKPGETQYRPMEPCYYNQIIEGRAGY